jgi:predicted DCC family thiol-disulfide oxidoreductase YuxK
MACALCHNERVRQMASISPVLGFSVIYDSHCGVCSRSVAWLRRQRADQPLRFLAADSEEAVRLVPVRPPNQMAIVGPGGEVLLGSEGWVACLSALPRYRWMARVMGWPVVKPFVRVGYGLVARNRMRISAMLGRKADACEIR